MIRTIAWQTVGDEPTLDSRLNASRGWSKAHALRSPRPDSGDYEDFATAETLCGREVPVSEDILQLNKSEWTSDVDCKACKRALGARMEKSS